MYRDQDPQPATLTNGTTVRVIGPYFTGQRRAVIADLGMLAAHNDRPIRVPHYLTASTTEPASPPIAFPWHELIALEELPAPPHAPDPAQALTRAMVAMLDSATAGDPVLIARVRYDELCRAIGDCHRANVPTGQLAPRLRDSPDLDACTRTHAAYRPDVWADLAPAIERQRKNITPDPQATAPDILTFARRIATLTTDTMIGQEDAAQAMAILATYPPARDQPVAVRSAIRLAAIVAAHHDTRQRLPLNLLGEIHRSAARIVARLAPTDADPIGQIAARLIAYGPSLYSPARGHERADAMSIARDARQYDRPCAVMLIAIANADEADRDGHNDTARAEWAIAYRAAARLTT